jgi:hypothetical protein
VVLGESSTEKVQAFVKGFSKSSEYKVLTATITMILNFTGLDDRDHDR